MELSTDRERSRGQMEANILESSTMERSKGRVSIFGKTAGNMMASGRIIKLLDVGSSSGLTARNILASSKTM